MCDWSSDRSDCDYCLHHDLKCTFNRPRPVRKGTSRRKAKNVTAARLEQIEEFIARHITPGNENPSLLNREASSAIQKPKKGATTGQMYFAGRLLGAIDAQTGLLSFSIECQQRIFVATGQWPTFQAEELADSTQGLSSARDKAVARHTDLPEKSIAMFLVATFERSPLRYVLPLIDPVLFRHTLELAYSPDAKVTSSQEGIIAKACVLAFLCFANFHFPGEDDDSQVDCDMCLRVAQTLLAEFRHDTSLTMLQAVLILGMFQAVSGSLETAVVFHAMACQILVARNAHVLPVDLDLEQTIDPIDQEARQLRTLFWICYIIDKDITLRTGRSPVLNDEYCDLTLPPGYLDCRFKAEEETDGLSTVQFMGDIRLSFLKSKTARLLYSADAMAKSDATLLQSIRELDEELENWRLSIPTSYSPTLSISSLQSIPLHTTVHKAMQHVELSLEYHRMISLIHSASYRCTSLSTSGESQGAFVLRSSMELCVEASRSTLIYLNVAAFGFYSGAFWVFVFYPTLAAVILFFNVIDEPGTEQARLDVELIKSTGSLIDNMSDGVTSGGESKKLEQLKMFLNELARLGQCAVDRAR
ncbi:hypothetical protein FDECE_13340 [Fusarium decemcellulare]|nr:hypothetical protein FDECE_13340 [Fusarium decemcellulare]